MEEISFHISKLDETSQWWLLKREEREEIENTDLKMGCTTEEALNDLINVNQDEGITRGESNEWHGCIPSLVKENNIHIYHPDF